MSAGPQIAFAACHLQPRRRAALAEALVFAARPWGERLGPAVAAPPKVEDTVFSAVLVAPERAFDALVALEELVWPAPLRGVLVGVGRHTGEEAQRRARLRATEVLEQAQRDGQPFRFVLPGREEDELALAGACAELHALQLASWTATRQRAVLAYRRLGRQKLVAEEMGVTQQAVSQMLRGARLREILRCERVMGEWFSRPSRPGLWPLPHFTPDGDTVAAVE